MLRHQNQPSTNYHGYFCINLLFHKAGKNIAIFNLGSTVHSILISSPQNKEQNAQHVLSNLQVKTKLPEIDACMYTH